MSLTRTMRRTIALLTAAIAGCSTGPDYRKPEAPVPAQWQGMQGWKQAEPRDGLPRGPWWTIYRDAVLDDLSQRAASGNQNLRVAEARLRQAQAITAQARAGFMPVVSASGGVTRSGSGTTNPLTTWSGQADVRWEADVWGRIHRGVEAATADLEGSVADLEAARLSTHAAVAQNYFALRNADATAALLEESVAAFERSVELTRNRYDAGVAARVDIVQAEVQRDTARAQRIDVEIDRARFQHALALLLGVPPAGFEIARNAAPVTLPDVPVELPSALLERRPDIAGQERSVAAANARIGVAQSALFPGVTLSASRGQRASLLADLLSAPSRFWSLGAALAQTLFDGGARRALTDQAIAVYDAEVALYRQTVLTAFAEVEDQLATLRILEDEIRMQDEVVRSARQAELLVTNQYKAGVVSFLNVLNAQTTALAAERTRLALVGRRYASHVLLIKALGGGWHADLMREGAGSRSR